MLNEDNDLACHPIIYVRGYAMTRSEQDETAADPFCGFNLGSTVYRSAIDKDKPARKFVFESPVLRLMSEFGYSDVYEDGFDIQDAGWEGSLARKSIVIYRYYDQASELLGSGQTPPIGVFAEGLADLILRVRDLVCSNPKNAVAPDDFRCYLVAHSMGGLVCRALLQNPTPGRETVRRFVDKVFTYATPHNGIEMGGVNVPEWLGLFDMNNFNRAAMAKYLKLDQEYAATGRVDWLPEAVFPAERFFCMVGTNRSDYQVAMGLSRTFSGNGSDGLVKIDNAAVWGRSAQGASIPCATAYAYRAHSGYFGIVNSEESYQNLRRFLFGDVRADLWVDVERVLLPPEINGQAVDALYQFELLAAPRGKRWFLSRRVAEEDSVACRSHQDLTAPGNDGARRIYLSSVFLDRRARVAKGRASLAYSVSLGVRVPDYEVERKFWANGHYEGAYLFHDTAVIELILPEAGAPEWSATYSWLGQPGVAATPLLGRPLSGGKIEFSIPFASATKAPGISGQLRFVAAKWNS